MTENTRSASTDAIRNALERATWPPCIGLDQHDTFAAKEIAEFVVAAIRAMTPTEQAELIGGDVQDPFGKSSDWDTYARVIGPWRGVTP